MGSGVSVGVSDRGGVRVSVINNKFYGFVGTHSSQHQRVNNASATVPVTIRVTINSWNRN